MLILGATSSHMGSQLTVDRTYNIEVCGNCVEDDNGDIVRSECAAAVPAAFPWWLIILLVVVVCTLIAVALFVGLRNRKKNNLVSLLSCLNYRTLSRL